MTAPALDLSLLEKLTNISLEAGEAIMAVYNRGQVEVRQKENQTPVTEADLAADHVIQRELVKHWSLPVLSEEVPVSWDERRTWEQYWLVDPLDGTRGFINRNAAFTVNIALIDQGRPVAGVVLDPRDQTAWSGAVGLGLYKNGEPVINSESVGPLVAAASLSHRTPRTDEFLKNQGITETRAAGSSIKFAMVASGEADLYPRLGPTSEWDTAAGQVLVEAAGGRVVTLEGREALRYGKEDILNPDFIALRVGLDL